MEFELNAYHRDIPKEELISDLRRVANELKTDYVSRSVYEKYGKFSATPFISNFGTWILTLKEAGLRTDRNKTEYKKISDTDLLDNVKYVAEYLSKNSITTSEYKEYGLYSISIILDRFGSWENTLKKANLEETGFIKKIDTYDLLKEIERLWILLGRQPTTTDLKNGNSKYSLNSFTRRFGGWRNALEEFVKYINSEETIQPKEEKSVKIEKDTNVEIKNVKIKTRRTPRDINERLRFQVLKRDNFKCVCCGKSPATNSNVELHVDHIIPWSKGGETVIENLQTLCSKCNLGKGNII